jgi:two-component system nitrogen regulation response regulator NtrX
MSRILVVDDEASVRESLELILQFEGHEVLEAPDGARALEIAAEATPEVVLLDIRMPGKSGLDVLREIKERHPDVTAVILSAQADLSTAVEAVKRGAFDFLQKPLDRDKLLLTVRNALRQRELADENRRLRDTIDERWRILGSSAALRRVLARLDRAAPTDAWVLITGETGTGKELVARRIHALSRRRDGPFVDVNCAAIPRDLVESELFGHEKGAFTGAQQQKKGKFELAHRGTLFLDEVGDMGLESQSKMLRVLEEKKIERVGGSTAIPVDVRVIAATNKDLELEVAEKRFREDLYFRLKVVEIQVPPLRERLEDLPVLAPAFVAEACRRNNLPVKRLTDEAIAALHRREWPGNVRELRNLMESVAILTPGSEIRAEDVAAAGAPRARSGDREVDEIFEAARTFEEFKDRIEAVFLRQRLEANKGNVKKTAEQLGMVRSNFYKKIEKYGLKHTEEGQDPLGS